MVYCVKTVRSGSTELVGLGFLCLTTDVLADENYNLTGNVKNAVLFQ